jgi:hypothetical protein
VFRKKLLLPSSKPICTPWTSSSKYGYRIFLQNVDKLETKWCWKPEVIFSLVQLFRKKWKEVYEIIVIPLHLCVPITLIVFSNAVSAISKTSRGLFFPDLQHSFTHETLNMGKDAEGFENKNDCTGEDQQQFTRPTGRPVCTSCFNVIFVSNTSVASTIYFSLTSL